MLEQIDCYVILCVLFTHMTKEFIKLNVKYTKIYDIHKNNYVMRIIGGIHGLLAFTMNSLYLTYPNDYDYERIISITLGYIIYDTLYRIDSG